MYVLKSVKFVYSILLQNQYSKMFCLFCFQFARWLYRTQSTFSRHRELIFNQNCEDNWNLYSNEFDMVKFCLQLEAIGISGTVDFLLLGLNYVGCFNSHIIGALCCWTIDFTLTLLLLLWIFGTETMWYLQLITHICNLTGLSSMNPLHFISYNASVLKLVTVDRRMINIFTWWLRLCMVYSHTEEEDV